MSWKGLQCLILMSSHIEPQICSLALFLCLNVRIASSLPILRMLFAVFNLSSNRTDWRSNPNCMDLHSSSFYQHHTPEKAQKAQKAHLEDHAKNYAAECCRMLPKRRALAFRFSSAFASRASSSSKRSFSC